MQSDSHPDSRYPPLSTVFTSSVNPTAQPADTESPADIRRRSVPHHLAEPSARQAMASVSDEKFASKLSTMVEIRSLDSKEPSINAIPARLTFWQRFFCKPVKSDPENLDESSDRRFSFLSLGTLVSGGLTIVVLLAIIVPVIHYYTGINGYYRHHIPPTSSGIAFVKAEAGPINQAVASNFADPFIIQRNGTWYAFATNNAVGVIGVNATALKNISESSVDHMNVQIATSTDFLNWTLLDNSINVLPQVGNWSVLGNSTTYPYSPEGAVWAPAILQRPSDDKYVLYYSAKDAANLHVHCIGAAISDEITGPYEPLNTTFACTASEGGSIDPSPFIDDDGSVYVAFKVDGNNDGNGGECGNTITPIHSTPILLQKVDKDGVTVIGDTVEILDRTAADGPLVEAPSLVKVNGTYFLFFSSGCTRDSSYTVKYAWASDINGPYTRASHDLLESGMWSLSAPGSCTVTQCETTGQWAIAFHARVATGAGGVREMFTAGIEFGGTNGTEVQIVKWD